LAFAIRVKVRHLIFERFNGRFPRFSRKNSSKFYAVFMSALQGLRGGASNINALADRRHREEAPCDSFQRREHLANLREQRLLAGGREDLLQFAPALAGSGEAIASTVGPFCNLKKGLLCADRSLYRSD
jgi:hypothetical protein